MLNAYGSARQCGLVNAQLPKASGRIRQDDAGRQAGTGSEKPSSGARGYPVWSLNGCLISHEGLVVGHWASRDQRAAGAKWPEIGDDARVQYTSIPRWRRVAMTPRATA